MQRFLRIHWRMIAAGSFTMLVVAFVAICLVIGAGVRDTVADARSHHPGDPLSALLAVASDEDLAPVERNRAIWALGQLGRREALPALRALVAPGPCDHAKYLCQYEIEKAIAACSGSRNIGAVIWRHGDLAAAKEDLGSSL